MLPGDDILARFAPLHPKKIDLSLGRIERLLAAMGSPEKRLPPVIHVAGTNGKGSTVAFMRAILEAAGLRVHVYTSPHLVRFHERIRLGKVGGGALVGNDELVAAFDRCETLNAGEPITIFEITTAAAFQLFADNPADVLLLEVGLGGRVDATNVIERPALSVITPVSFDHPEFLGADVATIAGEKAGILKRGTPAVFGRQSREALAVLERQAARLGLRPLINGEQFHAHAENGRLVYEDEKGLLDLPPPRLAGGHQFDNAGTAIAAIRTFAPDLGPDAFEKGVAQAEWPARMQRLTRGALVAKAPKGAEVWLDGGHNEDGARVLAQAMADLGERADRPLVMICGMLTTKDSRGFLNCFRGLAQELIAVPVAGEHAGRDPAEIATLAREAGIESVASNSVSAALDYLAARDWRAPPRILICGSLYLAGDVLAENGTPPV